MAKSQDQDIPAHSQRYEKWISTGKEPHEKKKSVHHIDLFSVDFTTTISLKKIIFD